MNRFARGLRFALTLFLVLGLAACESAAERIAGHMERGAALVAAGEDEKARLEFSNALKLDPDYLPAHLALARLYERAGAAQPMAGHLQRIVELDPKNAWALTRLAQIALWSGDPELAQRHAEAAVAAAPGDADALATRAVVSYALGNAAPALADARKATELVPHHALAGSVLVRDRALGGDLDGALALADEYLAAHPDDDGLNRLKLGILGEKQDSAGLARQLERMVVLYPGNLDYWAALLQWQVASGDPEGAAGRLRDRVARPGDDAALRAGFVALTRAVISEIARVKDAAAARTALAGIAGAAAISWPYRLMLAEFDHDNGRAPEAKTALEAMVRDAANPEDANEARLVLARILAAEKDAAGAGALIEAVLAKDTRNVEALALRAALALDAGRPEAALADLNTAIGQSARNPRLLTLLAETQKRLGNTALAGETLAAAMQASEYQPAETLRYVDYLLDGGRTEAAETVLTDAEHHRPGTPELIARLAGLKLDAGKWADAEALAGTLRKLQGATGLADRISAAALSGEGRFDESAALLEKLTADPAESASAMAGLVATYLRADEKPRAEAFLAQVLKDNPANLQALYLTGGLRERDGDMAAAEAEYRAIVAARPDLPRSHEILAEFQLRRQDPDAAEATLRAGLERLPDNSDLRMRLAGIQEQKGEIDAAIATYEAIIAHEPDALVVINNLVSLVTDHHADDPERLKRALDIARPLAGSTIPQLQDTYGWVLYLTGDYAGALRSLTPAAAALADNPWVRYHIGMTLMKLGRGNEARGHLAAALDKAGAIAFPPADTVRAALATLGG
jgi:tetratricopeptide (TPR) repeat protein